MPRLARSALARLYLLSAAGWGAMAVMRTIVRVVAMGRPVSAAPALFGHVTLVLLPWAIATPLVLLLAERLARRQTPLVRAASSHIAAWLAITSLGSAWSYAALTALRTPIGLDFPQWILSRLDQDLFIYVGLLALAAAARRTREYRRTHFRSVRLQTELLRARLHVLTLQLQPHFLFNTLHAVTELVHRDADAARRTVGHLRHLLRQSLDATASQEIPLADELRLLESYIEIQRTRFADSLTVEIDAAAETLTALVPRLVLQPLVENAIRHGTSRRAAPGRVIVQATVERGRLVLSVTDDGPGLAAAPAREGLGLGTTRGRLRELYGAEQRLTLSSERGSGTVARLELPLRPRPPAPDAVVVPGVPADSDSPLARPLSPARLLAYLTVGWMLAGLVGAHEDLVAVRLAGESDPFTRLLLLRLADSALWAALSAPVLLLSARLAASGTRLAARLAAHVFAAVAVAGAHVLLVRVLGVLPQDVPTPFLIAIFLTDLCIYGAIAALGHGWGTHRLAAAEELETARLQGELAAAELEALGWELEPEFLLSALEAIGELAATDAARADELTAQTGELLRLVLAGHGVSEVPLAREIDLLRAHLAVQTAVEPPGTRLGVAIEPGADLAPVPPMLLAPLAGVLGHDVGSGERCLALRASRAGDELVLALRAPSLSEEAVLRPFGALAAIRGRLAALHGPAARCDVSGENGAHTITIRLPWRRAGAARAREVA